MTWVWSPEPLMEGENWLKETCSVTSVKVLWHMCALIHITHFQKKKEKREEEEVISRCVFLYTEKIWDRLQSQQAPLRCWEKARMFEWSHQLMLIEHLKEPANVSADSKYQEWFTVTLLLCHSRASGWSLYQWLDVPSPSGQSARLRDLPNSWWTGSLFSVEWTPLLRRS